MAEIPLPASGAACKTCRFWKWVAVRNADGREQGRCRAHPPTAFDHVESSGTMWPEVWGDDWCGEYAPAGVAK